MDDPFPDLSQSLLTILFNMAAGITTLQIITIASILIFLLLISAAFSASEIAYFSLTQTQIDNIRRNETERSRLVLLLLEKPKRLLATILIVNIFINVSIVVLFSVALTTMFGFSSTSIWGVILLITVISALILTFGEIMPKIYASNHNNRVACMMARPLLFTQQFLYPLSSLLVNLTNVVDRKIAYKGHSLTMDELSEALDLTSQQGESPTEERKILQGIVKFGDIAVREIMRPRIDVTAVDDTSDFTELLSTINESGYSRIPIFNDNLDNVTGILYIKDLIPHIHQPAEFPWQPLQRPAFFVPENKRINDLLQEFQTKKIHMAIVVDEYGGTSGIVTMEDILEEIVGEINDEFDIESDDLYFNKVDDHTYVFEGKTLLNDFCKVLDIDDRIFQEVKGESDTLAGLILEMAGQIPELDDQFSHANFTFKVEEVDKRSIKLVRVSFTEPVEEE